MALRLTIHLSLLGKTGFRQLAELNLAKATDARAALCSMDGFRPRFSGPSFNEFTVTVPGGDAEEAARKAAIRGVVAGVPLGRFYPELKDTLLVGVNETHRREDIVRLTKSFKSIS
jgi:glycine dehydrogenase subunit 1